MGQFPSESGYRYILTIIDRYSRFVSAIPLQEITAITVSNALVTNRVSIFGVPSSVTTDRGSNFESRIFKAALHAFGCQKFKTLSYSPQSNGVLERVHQRIKDAFRASADPDHWVRRLPFVVLNINNAMRSDGQDLVSPAEIVFGSQVQLPADILVPQTGEGTIMQLIMQTCSGLICNQCAQSTQSKINQSL